MSIVYVLSNEGMPGLLKIGRTKNLQQRMDQLFTSGVPYPFKREKAVQLSSGQEAKALEAFIHQAFDHARVKSRREFFRIDPKPVIDLLDAYPGGEDCTYGYDGHRTDEGALNEDAAHRVRFNEPGRNPIMPSQGKSRGPLLRLDELGIPNGSVLSLFNNEDVTCTVVDAATKTVSFRGGVMQWGEATRIALKIDYGPRPGDKWKWNEKLISDLWDEHLRAQPLPDGSLAG